MTEKAIYGMAMPFNDNYADYYEIAQEFMIDRTNKEATKLDSLIGATIDHDFNLEIGRSNENLEVHVTNDGVFYKIVPATPLGHQTYERVKKGELNGSSISYVIKRKKRDYEAEQKLRYLSSLMGWKEQFTVFTYTEILVYELCLTNRPANEATFSTTDKNDSRLKGVRWKEPGQS